MLVNVTEVVRDEGTIIIFAGQEAGTGTRSIHFAVDHRPAQGLIEALATGEFGEAPLAEVEEWQIVAEFGDEPDWIDRHSVNCAICGRLFDERDAIGHLEDEGDVCPSCAYPFKKRFLVVGRRVAFMNPNWMPTELTVGDEGTIVRVNDPEEPDGGILFERASDSFREWVWPNEVELMEENGD